MTTTGKEVEVMTPRSTGGRAECSLRGGHVVEFEVLAGPWSELVAAESTLYQCRRRATHACHVNVSEPPLAGLVIAGDGHDHVGVDPEVRGQRQPTAAGLEVAKWASISADEADPRWRTSKYQARC